MALEIVRRELLADGRIVCYRFDTLGTEAAEEWYTDVTESFYNWPDDTPFLMLIDVCGADNFLSAEAMMRARQVSGIRKEMPGKTAILIDKTESADNLILFIDKALQSTRAREVFEDEAAAVAWLLEA
ncbi:MAG: hypothetical protein IPK19_13575 [Chloroflexi bacterium]|nr:hypothetical protein [Chloroflexota bacterium]